MVSLNRQEHPRTGLVGLGTLQIIRGWLRPVGLLPQNPRKNLLILVLSFIRTVRARTQSSIRQSPQLTYFELAAATPQEGSLLLQVSMTAPSPLEHLQVEYPYQVNRGLSSMQQLEAGEWKVHSYLLFKQSSKTLTTDSGPCV